MMGAAGAASADPLYVEDVFSTYLYRGTKPTPQNISNGIDLSSKGGMVWIKNRNASNPTETWVVNDSERNIAYSLVTSSNLAEHNWPDAITSFNSDGFTVGNDNDSNKATFNIASWTFRKCPGFFDVVTWTGNGVDERLISHNLGSTPGMIMVKCTSDIENWIVWHRNLTTTNYLQLNTNDAVLSGIKPWGTNTQTINSTHFSVNNYGSVNSIGRTYVAYLFAHDDQSFGTNSNESIIKCGSYTGDGTTSGNTINVGFEPQWLLIKNRDQASQWVLFDYRRGTHTSSLQGDNYFQVNADDIESSYDGVDFRSNGFELKNNGSWQNTFGNTFLYVAIRRPFKPPTAGSDVYGAIAYSGDSNSDTFKSTPFAVDMLLTQRTTGGVPYMYDNVRGGTRYIATNGSSAESGQSNAIYGFWNNSLHVGDGPTINQSGSNYLLSLFKRTPGVFDIVAYQGDASSSNVAINHNLGVKPDMMIVKDRERSGTNWITYHSNLTATHFIRWNTSQDPSTSGSLAWNDTEPTSTQFTVGSNGWDTNYAGSEYFAYLFATLPGISKVGSYTGNGSSQTIDCGFTTGARLVIIKRAQNGASGDWYMWNYLRGINAGNDPYMKINTSDSEVTNTDYIDPDPSGFAITSSAPAEINSSSENYIFFAIS